MKLQEIRKKDLIFFTAIWGIGLLLIGLYPTLQQGMINYYLVIVSIILLVLGLSAPNLFKYPYLCWVIIGEFVGKIISQIILTIIFWGIFTPISLLFKITKRDVLQRKIFKKKKSYWIARDNQPTNFKYQY